MFRSLFSRKPKTEQLRPEIAEAVGQQYYVQLKLAATAHFPKESTADLTPSDVESWIGLAALAFLRASISTAARLGRPVTDPQDLLLVSTFAWIVLQGIADGSQGFVPRAMAEKQFGWVVFITSASVLGEDVPDDLVQQLKNQGKRDAIEFIENSSIDISEKVRQNFQVFIHSKQDLTATFLGKMLKILDET
jgi:hypothetical protein